MRLLAAAFICVLAGAAHAGGWQTYRNDRFGTTADVPAGWRMGEAPENNDGRVFTSPEGSARITVSGIRALLPRDDEFSLMGKPGDGETVEYSRRGRDWLVVSGHRGERIFYRKSLLSCAGALWNSVYLDYPAHEKAAFDPIVAHVAGSLRPGKGYDIGDCR